MTENLDPYVTREFERRNVCDVFPFYKTLTPETGCSAQRDLSHVNKPTKAHE